MTRIWTQVRSVEAGEVDLSRLDLDIRVQKPKEDPLEFDVQARDLSRGSWSRTDKGDLVRIRIGWDEADVATVCLGRIETAKPSTNGRDKMRRLKRIDESEASTKTRMSGRWRNRRPEEIVAAIAGEIGLTPIVEDGGGESSLARQP
jgi:phage protein D